MFKNSPRKWECHGVACFAGCLIKLDTGLRRYDGLMNHLGLGMLRRVMVYPAQQTGKEIQT